MDYQKQYNLLINRAKTRLIEGYFERHHVTPLCVGGIDNKSNIVQLTPEEHFVAHQLLIRIYDDEPSLVYAAMMMTVTSSTHKRNNKRYGWLKRKYQMACKTRVGEKNSSYGTCWVMKDGDSKKIKLIELDEYMNFGWFRGRKMPPLQSPRPRKERLKSVCLNCGTDVLDLKERKFCGQKCHGIFNIGSKHSDETRQKMTNSKTGNCGGINNSQYGTCWVTNKQDTKKIKKCDLDEYIQMGWRRGRI